MSYNARRVSRSNGKSALPVETDQGSSNASTTPIRGSHVNGLLPSRPRRKAVALGRSNYVDDPLDDSVDPTFDPPHQPEPEPEPEPEPVVEDEDDDDYITDEDELEEEEDEEEDDPEDHDHECDSHCHHGSDVDDDSDDDEPLVPKRRLALKRAAPVAKKAKSRRSAKKPRISDVDDQLVEDWLAEVNEKYPVRANDPDVKRFEKKLRALVVRLHEWAKSRDASWFRLPRWRRATTYSFRCYVAREDPDELTGTLLSAMPRIARKILGKEGLRPEDLLDLPTGAEDLRQRATYFDIVTLMEPSQVIRKKSRHWRFRNGLLVKTLKNGVDPKTARKISVYCGSVVGEKGCRQRMQTHVRCGNKAEETASASHYKEATKQNAVQNLRVAAAFQNPKLQPVQPDTDQRAPSVLLEGILMTYLGLYLDGKDDSGFEALHPQCTFDLSKELRKGLDLPNFLAISLNNAWPLYQG
ncbi:hypothetical protein UCRPA7_2785 [Phaeoacremonium minimum UCRPA7]|uniref:Uncharacterized protein n=1 Tax=Phaeoacremonium minimum (strain UCR-PA7) TaxID=1286976 RepID=R8BQZ5_PHAM7|nr:hypothetical protein UCRPA7_2785 [Phaeoacremonium minimum UCRPA7]EOO01715.1 hypothetical protein UCRPA7_2785 [Phaeoacremonium minimum UCRPA7]